MTGEILLSNLTSIQQQLRRTEALHKNFRAAHFAIRKSVVEYEEGRIELFHAELQSRQLTWCTRCSKICRDDEVKLLLIEGKKEVRVGGDYGFDPFCTLHRACASCTEKMLDKHGSRGRYDDALQDQASFFAFRAEKREDGYCARKFGAWVKVAQEEADRFDQARLINERLANQWSLPPRITLERNLFSPDKLIIHEKTDLAEAV